MLIWFPYKSCLNRGAVIQHNNSNNNNNDNNQRQQEQQSSFVRWWSPAIAPFCNSSVHSWRLQNRPFHFLRLRARVSIFKLFLHTLLDCAISLLLPGQAFFIYSFDFAIGFILILEAGASIWATTAPAGLVSLFGQFSGRTRPRGPLWLVWGGT